MSYTNQNKILILTIQITINLLTETMYTMKVVESNFLLDK